MRPIIWIRNDRNYRLAEHSVKLKNINVYNYKSMKHFLSDTSLEYVGERLKMFRKTLGVRQVDLAKEFSWSPQKWGQWENGVRNPNVSDMIKLAERYGVTLDYIYRGDMSRLPEWMDKKIREIAASESRDAVRVQFRFVLALILMRKRLLRYDSSAVEDGREVWQMTLLPEKSSHQVVNPQLSDNQIDGVSEQLGAVLHGDVGQWPGDTDDTGTPADPQESACDDD